MPVIIYLNMSKEFFSILGDQLCSIRRSPFTRIGEAPAFEQDLIRSQLSYNPDRLFNKEKYQDELKGGDEKEFVEIKQAERAEAERAEYEMLREATLEDFEKKMKELGQQHDDRTAPKQHSLFKIKRTICLMNNKCTSFVGNFSKHPLKWEQDRTKTVPFLSCRTCRCPMSAHAPLPNFTVHRHKLWKYFKTKQILDHHLNTGYFTAAFRVRTDHEQQDALSWLQLVEKAGYSVRSYQAIDKWAFEMTLLRAELLAQKEESGVLEAALKLAECIESLGKWGRHSEVGEDFQTQHQILRRLMNQVRKRFGAQVQEDDSVVVLLIITSDQIYRPQEHRQLLKHLSKNYMSNVTLLHLPETKLECLFSAQQFFPEEFTLSSRLFLLPLGASQEPFYKFKDFVDYNDYNVMFENLRNVKRMKFENTFDFLTYSEQSYIMGNQVANETLSRLHLLYASKVGPLELQHYGTLPAHLDINDENNKNKVMASFFPDYCLGQRVIIVLRPFLMGSGLQEAVVNLLRLNNFIIIQRSKWQLSQGHAHYLATVEHIPADDIDSYIQMMTSGVAEVILVSKRSALYEAHSLLNASPYGLADINPKHLKERPVTEVKRGKDFFKQELSLPDSQLPRHVFNGANSMLCLDQCLFSSQWQQKTRIIENCRNGQIMKISEEQLPEGDLKATQRQKEDILFELRSDTFNHILFNSKSDKTTEELVSLFFPQCTLFESVVVLIKPACVHLIEDIRKMLATLRYHIIFQKSVQLSKQFAFQLLESLQKIKLPTAEFNRIVETYSGQKVIFMCISKTSAKKEVLSLLSNFTFSQERTILQGNRYEQTLKEVLVPVWNNEEDFLKIFSRHLGSLQESVQLLTGEGGAILKKEQKTELLEYFVGSIFGVRPEADGTTVIGKMAWYNTNEELARYQSWYYSTLSSIHPSYVPLLFQYRTYGQQTLIVQSQQGEPFMECIVNQYVEEKKHLDAQNNREYSDKKGPPRRSLVLYLWAKKIIEAVEDLSVLTNQSKPISIEVEGWGDIRFLNNHHRGVHSERDQIEQQKEFFMQVMAKFKGNRHITANCKKMLESRLLEERVTAQHRRLLPGFEGRLGLQECLRVTHKLDANKLYLKDQFEMLDPDTEKTKDNPELMTLLLYRIKPFIATKYSFLASILLFFDKWRKDALDYRECFAEIYDHLIQAVRKYEDVEFLQFEMYYQILQQLMEEEITEQQVKVYPNLRKNRTQMEGDEEVVGKNRKFIEKKQYFKGWKKHPDDYMDQLRHKFTNFNLKTLEQPLPNNVLNNPNDPLHNTWANQQNLVNFMRDGTSQEREAEQGVYVEYEKRLNENEEKVKEKIAQQVDRMGGGRQETILQDKGLDNELWYKRVREGVGRSKVDDAIKKQLEKLNKFKQSSNPNATA